MGSAWSFAHGRDLLFHNRCQAGTQQCMDVLIVGKIDLSAQPIYPVPGIHMFIKAILITHMRVDKEYTGKGQGESENA